MRFCRMFIGLVLLAATVVTLAEEPQPTESSGRLKRGAPRIDQKKWNKLIPFRFNGSHIEKERKLIRSVISEMEQNTCLKFKENGTEGTVMVFYRERACSAGIGLQSGAEQWLSLGETCPFGPKTTHEIMHVLGMAHTQNRVDRDDWLIIDPSFDLFKLNSSMNYNFGVAYDYGSVMHYGEFDHGATPDGKARIYAKEDRDRWRYVMGQRRSVPFNDYKMINLMYNCSEKCPTQLNCKNGGYPSPKDCNKCTCTEFHTGTLCEIEKYPIKLDECEPTKLSFSSPRNDSLQVDDWWVYVNATLNNRDYSRVITAPEGSRINVTLTKIGNDKNHGTCSYGAVEINDFRDKDLTRVGFRFCNTTEQGYSFISKTNVIGYKAYAWPGYRLDSEVTFQAVFP